MRILWPRITPVTPAVCFTIAIVTIVSTRANADSTKTYGTVTGTLTINSAPDTKMQQWNGDPKLHYEMRADQTYTATSTQACNGKFDPHGEIGIYRYYQSRNPNAALVNGLPDMNALGPMSAISLLGPDRPANSPFTPSHTTSNYGPYTPVQSTYSNNKANTNTTTSANDVYGVETIQLVYVDGNGNPTTLDYQRIDVYYPNASNSANYNVQAFPGTMNNNAPGAALQPSTKPYLGDPPRVILTASDTLYPGATFNVYIYPGLAQAMPPANIQPIKSLTVPWGDNKTFQTLINNNYFIDVGKYVTGSGTYTIQATQASATNSFGTEAFGSAVTFTIQNKYNVTSQIGLSK